MREQLAGDLLRADSTARRNEQLVATGFLGVGVKDLRERNNHRYVMSTVEEQIDTVGRAMLGLTLACARCHDHKFDPIPTSDYYALAGIFASTEPLLGVSRVRHASPLTAGVQPLAGRPVTFTDADRAAMLKASLDLTQLRLKLRDEQRRVLVDSGKLKAKGGKKPGREEEAFLQKQPSVVGLRKKVEKAEAAYDALVARFDASLPHAALAVRDAGKPADLAIHIRGEDAQLGEVVPRGFPAVLTTKDTPKVNPSQSGRLELAEWVASPKNPLTARVMVNRIWQHLFGVGLVESPDDLGKTGQPPSNPALLDHLARRFVVAHGWSVKGVIRDIMRARVYQLAADHQAAAHKVDPANRLHWRANRRRLDANALRDALLAAGGDLILGRPPRRIPPTSFDARLKSFDHKSWIKAVASYRTVYLPVLREYVPDELTLFDFPEPEFVTGRRDVTTVPTQALFLMNNPFVVEQSRKAAGRLLAGKDEGDADRVSRAYLLLLGRSPSAQESDEARTFLKEFQAADGGKDPRAAAWAALCQALIASGEFRYLY